MNTIFTETAISSLNDPAVYNTLEPIVVLTLILLIIQREMVTGVQTEFAQFYRQILLVGIVPLFFVTLLILGMHISQSP